MNRYYITNGIMGHMVCDRESADPAILVTWNLPWAAACCGALNEGRTPPTWEEFQAAGRAAIENHDRVLREMQAEAAAQEQDRRALRSDWRLRSSVALARRVEIDHD